MFKGILKSSFVSFCSTIVTNLPALQSIAEEAWNAFYHEWSFDNVNDGSYVSENMTVLQRIVNRATDVAVFWYENKHQNVKNLHKATCGKPWEIIFKQTLI